MTSVLGPNELTDVHPSAVSSNTQPESKPQDSPPPAESKDDANNAESVPPDSDYPEQKHAGKVGYGPNYHQKPGLSEKIEGLKEEIKGKVKHDPEMVQRGHDRITGDLKKKEMEEDMKEDPFADPEEKKKEQGTPKEEQKQQE